MAIGKQFEGLDTAKFAKETTSDVEWRGVGEGTVDAWESVSC